MQLLLVNSLLFLWSKSRKDLICSWLSWLNLFVFVLLYDSPSTLLALHLAGSTVCFRTAWSEVSLPELPFRTATLRQSNMAMENGPFINDFPIKRSIHRRFSIAMFDYQRVYAHQWGKIWQWPFFVNFTHSIAWTCQWMPTSPSEFPNQPCLIRRGHCLKIQSSGFRFFNVIIMHNTRRE